MRTKVRWYRILNVFVAAVFLLGVSAPVSANAFQVSSQTGNNRLHPVPVPTDLQISLAGNQIPLSLSNPNRQIQVGNSPDVKALMALGDKRINVSIELSLAPLSSMSNSLASSGLRVAYEARVSALQDKVISQVMAMAPSVKVLGRFKTLSSGFSADIAGKDAAAIAALPDVVSIKKINDYQLDLSVTVPWVGGNIPHVAGIEGKGIKVADIDTGIDFTHKAFGGPGSASAWNAAYFGSDPSCTTGTEPTCANALPPDPALFGPSAPRVKGGFDFIGDSWNGGSVTTLSPDPNPIDNIYSSGGDGHGTRVEDVIGGNGYAAYTDSDGKFHPGNGEGMAPGADLYQFKVCSSQASSCSGVALLNAVDAAADLDGNPATKDPVDVINLSVGSLYGQPEDDLTYFVNQAVNFGIIVSASAGNDGENKPFVVGSPSTADGAISVAATNYPLNVEFKLTTTVPTGVTAVPDILMVWQNWSATQSAVITDPLKYDTTNPDTRLGCSNAAGANPWTGTPLTGKVVLVNRGTCAVSFKAANIAAAGGVMALVANNVPQSPIDTPPSFSYGGGVVTIPAYTMLQSDGTLLKAALAAAGAKPVTVSVDPAATVSLADTMTGYSSHGPRNNDNALKPDIGAPSGSNMALAGTGGDVAHQDGTSFTAPMVSGAAALLKEEFGNHLQPYQYKALLMNTANSNVYMNGSPAAGGGGFLAPVSLIGAGSLDVGKAYLNKLIAWDSTGADPLTWTGSLSFHYQAVSDTYTETRTITVLNLDPALDKYVNISSSFRYANDENMGVTVEPVEASPVKVPKGGMATIHIKLTVNAAGLRNWFDPAAGSFMSKGAGGADDFTFSTFEYDGYIQLDMVTGSTVTGFITLPWYLIPKPVADTRATLNLNSKTFSPVTLSNASPKVDANAEVFSLMDKSPNLYNYTVGDCASGGMLPGCASTLVDIKEVGVRSYTVNFPPPTLLVDFGITLWDKPFRASQEPVEFDIYVDSNNDGTPDYVVFTNPLGGSLTDGRNAVYVYNLTTGIATPYFLTDSDFNSNNWIMTAPADALGLTTGQEFNFFVLAYDAYFTGNLTDCSPFADPCGSQAFTYSVGKPRIDAGEANLSLSVPMGSQIPLPFTMPAGGSQASPSQIGLLFMYRNAPVGQESSTISIFNNFMPVLIKGAVTP